MPNYCQQSLKAVFFPFLFRNMGASPTRHKEPERQLNWKPINYFNQYFSLDTWDEIAVCTRETSKLPNPVTEKEVAQYVGIHIAMGTLKVSYNITAWQHLKNGSFSKDGDKHFPWHFSHGKKIYKSYIFKYINWFDFILFSHIFIAIMWICQMPWTKTLPLHHFIDIYC